MVQLSNECEVSGVECFKPWESVFYMSVSVAPSMPMTSHRDYFPMVSSLAKLSLSPKRQESHNHTHHQPKPSLQGDESDDMITDKDESHPVKPGQPPNGEDGVFEVGQILVCARLLQLRTLHDFNLVR